MNDEPESATEPTALGGDASTDRRPDGMSDDVEDSEGDDVAVTFRLPSDVAAESASVVGDFNEWDPLRGVMQRDDSGSFSCSLAIRSGRTYQYRYLLDGDRWTNDWAAGNFAPNVFGGEDSLLDLSDPALDGAASASGSAHVDVDG